MLVMKFGGSSVADARQIDKVCEIVRGRLDRRPIVVASAHKGMTDLLIQAARAAARGEVDAGPLVERQRSVLRGVGADEWMLDHYFREIEDLLMEPASLLTAEQWRDVEVEIDTDDGVRLSHNDVMGRMRVRFGR